jgi:tRNA(fMet)-specific endonuclease VapC
MRQGDTVVIPPITYYEILRGFKHKAAPKKEFSFALICNAFGVGEMTLAAWEEAADIYARRRKTGNPIDDSGILIAAFCVVNNYALVTNNVKHFEGTDGLIIENWITE